jgi:hypothetical protein
MAGTDPDPRMRVLLVTVDSSAAVAATTEILGLTPRIGPEAVESRVDDHLDAVVVMDAVAPCYRPSDAAIPAIAAQARRSVEEDGADIVRVGCAAMAGPGAAVEAAAGAAGPSVAPLPENFAGRPLGRLSTVR